MPPESMPLSPHLGIYRWQITMTLSILHRASGVVLYAGACALVYWLVALALGPQAFATASRFFGSWIGQALLCLWSLAFFYHLLNGVRHLAWDAGWGFSRGAYRASGWLVVVCALALTGIAWACAWLLAGAAA